MLIGYARVSTKEQNLDMQINALKRQGCEIIFSEKRSAVKERPELEKMINYLRAGDIVVVWKLDRLARSLKHLLFLIEDFKKKGIGFISLSDKIDSLTTMGKFFLQITGAYAELERNIGVERTMEGLEAAKRRGVILGRRKGLSEERKAMARAVCQLYERGEMTPIEISKAFNISTATLYRYLKAKGIEKRNNYGRKRSKQKEE
jgi:DNA invertase Pin-like site-specific DNA recombinase